ncbi:MAG: twin-arginine translocation signal domain-containing protein, partial [Myxococcota bacterium]
MSSSRRRFLQAAGLGTASLTMPTWLGCTARKGVEAVAAAEAVPPNPFLTWFGVDGAVIRRVMAVLTARGADAADLYFEYTRSNSISLQDGVIG